MQQNLDQKSLSHSPSHPTRQPSKIKPCTTESSPLEETFLFKHLKRSTKTFKTIKPMPYSYISTLSHLEYFKKFVKILSTQNSSSKLIYSTPSYEVFPNCYVFSKIRNLASSAPPQLSLNFAIIDPWPKTALKNLSSLKNITHFHLHGDSLTHDPLPAFKALFFSLSRLKKLKSFSIDIPQQRDGKKISSFIARLSQLQSLKLRIVGSNLSEFTSLLPNLPHLTEFSLSLSGKGAILSEDLLAFNMDFQYTKALTDLTLDLSNYSFSNSKDIEPLSEGLKALNPSLMQKLRIKLCGNTPDEGLIKILEAFKRLKGLQTFHLFLRSLRTKETIISFRSALSELDSLSSLSIHFPSSDEDKFIILETAIALESLQNLVYLELHFKGKDTTKDAQIQKLSSSLKRLKGLEYLDLEFSQQKSLSDLAFKSLSEGFQELTSLKNLRLVFSSTESLTNKGVSPFCYAVKGLKNLVGLAFQLRSNFLDEKAIVEIAQMLREMHQLSDVHFSFDECVKIKKKEDALESLFQALKKLKNIDKITLQIDSSPFNQKAVEDLKSIKNVQLHWTY